MMTDPLAGILKREGYIASFAVEADDTRPRPQLRIVLKYTSDRKRTISGLRRISTPGLRVYSKADTIPRVLGGMGIAILSTNQGLLTDREARERRLGGEVLCQVW